jgi:RNA polymerase-associated protein CTR9
MATLFIPIKCYDSTETQQYIEVPVTDFPDNPADLISILQTEKAPLHVWLDCAVNYYKKGNPTAFQTVLNIFTDKNMEQHYRDDKSSLIAIFNSLAAYYTKSARQLPSMTAEMKQKKTAMFGQATQLFNKADSIDAREEITWVGKGIMLLFRGEFDKAVKQFQTVLEQNGTNIPALLGRACILFSQANYEQACGIYKKVIKINPNCPPSVRIGLANCYSKLNKPDLAKAAFERCLELDPPEVEVRVHALVGLAILSLNEGRSDVAVKLLETAYAIDPNNASVLNHFSNILFHKNERVKAKALAQKSLYNTNVPKIHAESYYYIGRISHAEGDYNQARENYKRSLAKWADFILPQFALGQLFIQEKEIAKAIKCFEKVHTLTPDNYEVLRILGSLYGQEGKSSEAITLLTQAVAIRQDDIDTFIELAQLQESTDSEKALERYLLAIKLMKSTQKEIPKEIWNNVGLLYHQLSGKSNYKLAESCYRQALTGFFGELPSDDLFDAKDPMNEAMDEEIEWDILTYLNGPQGDDLVKPINVTILYNIARLYEEAHLLPKARAIYDVLIAKHPHYADSYFRIGYMTKDSGDISGAHVWFTNAMEVDQSPQIAALTWTAIGNCHLDLREWNHAQKKYEQVRTQNRHNNYVVLQLANIFLQSAQSYAEKRDRFLGLAQDYFLSVLSRDKSNLYAANGLAVIFQEKGMIDEADEVFAQIKAACLGTNGSKGVKIPSLWINIGHMYLLRGKYSKAIIQYQACLNEFDNNDTSIQLCLASAYYKSGKYDECKKILQFVLRLKPWDKDLWYNLAITLLDSAQSRFDNKKSTAKEMAIAGEDFEAALPIFMSLSQLSDTVRRGFRRSLCNTYKVMCEQNMDLAKDKYLALSQAEQEREEELRKKEEASRKLLEEQEEAMRIAFLEAEHQAMLKKKKKKNAIFKILLEEIKSCK